MFIDKDVIAEQVREVLPGGADKALELVGPTLVDSLRCAKQSGIVCMTDTVAWTLIGWGPPDGGNPATICLTSYHGTASLHGAEQSRR